MTLTKKKVLYIGGHGKVGLLATPKMLKVGHNVHSLIRSESQVEEIENLGATAVLKDITKTSAQEWAELFADFDTVVWGAGNGGRGGADLTWAVDRDGAMATIDALELLKAEGKQVPDYVMISYVGATHNETDPNDESWYAYVESKKAVDNRLNSSELNYVILGPSALTEEPAVGIEVIEDTNPHGQTSRELVAEVITEVVGRESLPASPLAFIDGENPVSSI